MRITRRKSIYKSLPQRTCIICHKSGAKKDMIRLVYDNSGGVKIDPTGREKGRGTYLCLSPECNPNALRKSQLEHALRTSITEEGWREFQRQLQSMRNNG